MTTPPGWGSAPHPAPAPRAVRSLLGGGIAAAVVLLTTCPALAQRQTGFALDRYEPAERGSLFFANDTLDLHGDLRPTAGATLDYGHKPLVVYDPEGIEQGAIVRHQLFTHLGGSLVLADRIRVGLNLPLALYQDGEASLVAGQKLKPADKPAFGDIRLAADVRILGQDRDAFRLAGGLRAFLPSGQRGQFTGDGSTRLAPQILAAGDLGRLTYAARLAIVFRPRDDDYAGSPLGSEIAGSVGAGLRTPDGKLVIGPEVFTATGFTDDRAFFKSRGTATDWLFGVHYDLEGVRLGAGIGGGLSRGYGATQLRVLLSAEYTFPEKKHDRDADSIEDGLDACPDLSGPADPDPKKNGCPTVIDSDRDGIGDGEDACPTEAGPPNQDRTRHGCPQDNDSGDDRLDPADICPADPDPNNPDGCPPAAPPPGPVPTPSEPPPPRP
jgi:OmpA-OmpF porin, OOP family